MPKITIISVGKTKEEWLQAALATYQQRLSPLLELHFKWVRHEPALEQAVALERLVIGLDPKGQLFDSSSFARYLSTQLQAGGARLTFAIGGPNGLPAGLRRDLPLLSLSPLTFTHQLARLILVEQLYRALQILSGTPYHR
jgi:23S rRNA (pseudouridine1915-N3)-methyltransferase